MKKTVQEIVNGKNLEENLSVYANRMMNIYSDYSFVRLAMNYFTYYGMVSDGEHKDDKLKNIGEAINSLIKEAVVESVSGKEWENALKLTENIRQQVTNTMQGLVSYVDIFNIYEYCLNRVEYRFKDGSEFTKQSDEELVREIVRYILSDEDNVVINSKIAESVRQLPIRMTKSKFFELLKAGIGVYKGSEIESVENFIYMIKTSAMLEISPYTEELSDDVKYIYNELKNTSFANMTEAQYDDLKAKTDYAKSYITDFVDMYMTLGELINDIYVILLAKPYIITETKDGKLCRDIVKNVGGIFDKSIADEEYDRIAESFVDLEGRQEALQMKFSAYEYVTDQVLDEQKDMIKSLMLEKEYTSLKRISVLEEGSIFVEFKEKNADIADEKYIEDVTEQLTESLKDFFTSNEKMVNRAVMAHILAGLPVFFNNIEEIQDYVYNSLSQCSDKAEKAAVSEIMKQLENE